MSFTFGATTPKTTAGITLGTPTNPASTTGLTLGSTPGLSFGGSPAPGAGVGTGLTFGSATPGATGFSLGSGAGDATKTPISVPSAAVKPTASTAPLTSFSLGTTPTTTTSTTSTGFSGFGLTTTTSTALPTTSAPAFSFGAGAASTTAAPPAFSLSTSTTPGLKLGTTTATTAASTSSSATSSTTVNPLTFVQLSDTVNKWMCELQEQENIFISQADQLNKWDRLLNRNGEKIIALNNEMAEMKQYQQQLDHELNFISTQQRELEEVLAPLEKQASELPTNSDPEREHTYHMAETLDTQLKQMSDDLKEIIDQLNESSKTQDNSDPIIQISRILNAQMNTLHWIDQQSLALSKQLDNVTKIHDTARRENERSFRVSYE